VAEAERENRLLFQEYKSKMQLCAECRVFVLFCFLNKSHQAWNSPSLKAFALFCSHYEHSTVSLPWEIVFAHASTLELVTVRKGKCLTWANIYKKLRKGDVLRHRAWNFTKKMEEYRICLAVCVCFCYAVTKYFLFPCGKNSA